VLAINQAAVPSAPVMMDFIKVVIFARSLVR
jgi:hypothetical protein